MALNIISASKDINHFQIITEDPEIDLVSDTGEDLDCSPFVTPDSTAGMLLAIENIRTYLSCPITTCNMKKLQTVGEKLTCPSCKRTASDDWIASGDCQAACRCR